MTILWINNDGAGFAERLELPAGTTAAAVLSQKKVDARTSLVRLNHRECAAEQVLQDGDILTATPTKVEGAH